MHQKLFAGVTICLLAWAGTGSCGEVDVEFGRPSWTTVKVIIKKTSGKPVFLLDNVDPIRGNPGGSLVFAGFPRDSQRIPLFLFKAAEKGIPFRVHGTFLQFSAADLERAPHEIRWSGMPNIVFQIDRVHSVGDPDD
jgi:hypothetical protein